MRFVLKIFAAPFVLALTLTVGVLSFIFSLASWAFNILCLLCAVTALFAWFVGGDAFWGVRGLIIAFCVGKLKWRCLQKQFDKHIVYLLTY